MDISPSEKSIALHLQATFGTRPNIYIHRESEDDPFYVGIAQFPDCPAPGLSTLSTISASNSPLHQEDGSEFTATRVEFIASCLAGQEDDLSEALFRAAAFVGKIKGPARPGVFLRNLLGQFRTGSPVPHALLTAPVSDDSKLGTPQDFDGRTVAWLQVLPVSQEEIAYAREHSTSDLETLFEARDLDWTNLDRESVI